MIVKAHLELFFASCMNEVNITQKTESMVCATSWPPERLRRDWGRASNA